MKLKIGIMGSAADKIEPKYRRMAYQIGKAVAHHNCILINGACYGIPYEASRGARKGDGFIVGISPAKDLHDHISNYKFPTDIFDVIIYSGFGYKGRNVLNVASADGLVVVNGSVGTLNEFTIGYDEGRVIGILEGSGGIADHIREIIRITNKKTGATIIYESDPHKLISKVIIAIRKRGTHLARRTQ